MIPAVASVGALLAAGYAGLMAKKAADAAWVSVQKDQERERAAQASKVFSTPVRNVMSDGGSVFPQVEVSNGSELPVYDVVVLVTSADGGPTVDLTFPPIMPGDDRRAIQKIPTRTLMDVWGWTQDRDRRGNFVYRPPPDSAPHWRSVLRFRDASNQRWERDEDGVLKRLSD